MILFLIIESSNLSKLIIIIRSQIVVTLGGRDRSQERVFSDAGKVLFLNLGTGYSGVYTL